MELRPKLTLAAPVMGALLTLTGPAVAGVTSFTAVGSPKNWDVNANWSAGIPGFGDTVYIGNLAGVENAFVKLNSDVGPFSLVEVTDGMALDTNGHRLLNSLGIMTFDGQNQIGNIIYPSSLRLRESGIDIDAWIHTVMLSNEADVMADDGTKLRISEYMELAEGTGAFGAATLEFQYNDPAGVALNNFGHIGGQPGNMYLDQLGAAKFDLDGVGDVGHSPATISAMINQTQPALGSTIEVNGTALTDEFDGELRLGGDGRIDMNLSSGWTLGPDGIVTFLGGPNHHPVLGGDTMTVLGNIEADARNSLIEADVMILNGAHTTVHENDTLTFTGNTVANTTMFTVNDGGTLDFTGPSNLTNNGYDLLGGSMTGAIIVNNNAHGIRGHGTVDNRVISDGMIWAEGGGTLLINGTSNDWDGPGGAGEMRAWGADLHLTNTVDTTFEGAVRVFPDDELFIDGFELDMLPTSYMYIWNGTYRSNERQQFGGEIDALFTVDIDADVDVLPTADVGIGDRLNMNQEAVIAAGATVIGGPTAVLVGGANGTLNLADGAVADVDVQAQGTMLVDANFGTADINDNFFLNGVLQLQLGPAPIGQFDHLNIADTIEARGHFDVVMVNYQPQLGDAFDVLDFTTFVDLGYTMGLPILPANLMWDTTTFEIDGVLRIIVDPCPTDINKDGVTNVQDLLILLAEWGPVGIQSDFNEDGIVNTLDLLELLINWGAC